MPRKRVRRKVALVGPGFSKEFETAMLVGEPEKINYKPKTINLDSLIATGMGLRPQTLCKHGKEVTLCGRCSRKEGIFISR